MIGWFRKRLVRVGKVIVLWPARDLKEDRLVVDVSRLDQGIVGFKRRRYGVYPNPGVVPDYGVEVEFVPLADLWKAGPADIP